MYESFFGFKDKPFSLLPDPRLFYPSQIHQEALMLLEYGLYNQAGFMVITGEIGSGKTILMRYLLDQLKQDMTVGLISHTHQSLGRIMDWICAAFAIQTPRSDPISQHQAFVDFLVAEYAKGRKTLLIIDEAQNLDRNALEEIRLLSNINSKHDILLRLLLLGQPELREQLRQPGLEQFIQRISVSYHLGRLSLEDSCRYVRHQLRIAGGRPDIFTPDACHAIFHYSQGIPRLINLICDSALVFAYGTGESRIDGHAIDTFVRSDGSHLLFAIDGQQIEPLPEYRPILADELEEEMQRSEQQPAWEYPIRATHTKHGRKSERLWVEPPHRDQNASETSRPSATETRVETIVPRLHTATSPPEASNTLAGGDHSAWVTTDAALGFGRHRSLASGRRGRRWGWEFIAMVIGVLSGVGLMGWHLQQSGLSAITGPIAALLGQDRPAPPREPDPEGLAPTPETVPDTAPFDVLNRLAQEPSDPEADAVAPSERVAGPDPAQLEWLESGLAALSIPFERLAPNHLRADLSRHIRFRDGSVALDKSARTLLDRLAELLKQDTRVRIHIVTHTDSQGAAANNRVLSERRAADIALILRLAGIGPSRITHEGKGMSEPRFTREEERRLGPWINRRVELDLIASDEAR
ncbi:MAG: AAA family ATPase [Thermochromatium sp.]